MRSRPPNLPVLYVEGPDDVSAIAALLKRHNYDTNQGTQHLYIAQFGNVEKLLDAMSDTIKAERSTPCGFVLDIDIEVTSRWQAVADRLKFQDDPMTELEVPVSTTCPKQGYIGKVKGYPHPFGVWLMPDCASDHKKLEDLISTLIPDGDPLRSHAEKSTTEAERLIGEANTVAGQSIWSCFGERDRIKAQVRTWLAWQKEPGMAFGAAITSKILRHDSVEAMAFLNWMKQLYGFNF